MMLQEICVPTLWDLQPLVTLADRELFLSQIRIVVSVALLSSSHSGR